MWADFAVIDLGHPALAGYDVESLLDSIVFGADAGVIHGTAVGEVARSRIRAWRSVKPSLLLPKWAP